jgi:hypothetical protein
MEPIDEDEFLKAFEEEYYASLMKGGKEEPWLYTLDEIKSIVYYPWPSKSKQDLLRYLVDKLGLTLMVTVIRKGKADDKRGAIDICFDDETVTNGKVNIKVKRPNYNKE